MVAVAGLSDGLQKRLRAAGVDTSGPSGQALDPWEAWLRLRAHSGRRATLVDLYELEAARQKSGRKSCRQPTGNGSRPPHCTRGVTRRRCCLAAPAALTRTR